MLPLELASKTEDKDAALPVLYNKTTYLFVPDTQGPASAQIERNPFSRHPSWEIFTEVSARMILLTSVSQRCDYKPDIVDNMHSHGNMQNNLFAKPSIRNYSKYLKNRVISSVLVELIS